MQILSVTLLLSGNPLLLILILVLDVIIIAILLGYLGVNI